MKYLLHALVAIATAAIANPCSAQMRFHLINSHDALENGNPDGWFQRTADDWYAITIDEHRKGKYGHQNITNNDILLCTRRDKTAYCRFRSGQLIELSNAAQLPKLTLDKRRAIVWLGGSRTFVDWSIKVNLQKAEVAEPKVVIAQRRIASNDGKWSRAQTLATGDWIVLGHQKYLLHRIVPSDPKQQLIGWVELGRSK